MSSVLDFLFEGRPPQSVTTYGQTVENIPKWMSDYTQGLVARANAAAAEPYIPYGGPRIAGFSPEQQAAFGLVEGNVGAYQPYLEAGAAGYGGGLRRAANIGRAAAPFVSRGAELFTDPGVVEDYMNPYVQNVLDRQESLATRTLEEDFLPAMQRTFAGAGSYGSRGGVGSMEEMGVRGIRDIQEGLEEQRLATLGQAYGQAADIFGADRARQAELAQIVGALEEAGAAQMFAGAEGLGRMGEAAQRMGLADAAAMADIGEQIRGLDQRSLDLAYQDFLEQRDLPFDRLAFMNQIIRGLPMDRAQTRTDVGPADVYQPSGLSQLVGAYGTYRGLTEAEGGYIEPGALEHYTDGDITDEFKHEYDDYAEGGYAYPKGFADGGLARYAAGGSILGRMFGGAPQFISTWVDKIVPNLAERIGSLSGKKLYQDTSEDDEIELQWKQD